MLAVITLARRNVHPVAAEEIARLNGAQPVAKRAGLQLLCVCRRCGQRAVQAGTAVVQYRPWRGGVVDAYAAWMAEYLEEW